VRPWQRPLTQVVGVILILGLFTWWILQTVSLPPAVRNLFEEDQAVVTAASPPSPEEDWRAQSDRLPPWPQEHAPEVAALIERLKNLPLFPYLLANALARDAATPGDQKPPPWTAEELSALEDFRQAYLQAWRPFLEGPAPLWSEYPDSVLLFRSTTFLLGQNEKAAQLMTYRPGQRRSANFVSNPAEAPELMLPLLRQCRNLGAIRFGVLQWEYSETIRTAELTANAVIDLVSEPEVSREWLESLRDGLAPAPTMLDLRAGLAADRALFLKAAEFMENLPYNTTAPAGLFHILRDKNDTRWYLRSLGNPQTASEVGTQLRRDAEQLESLRQKTFLSGPAWRQWLSEDPGQGLNPVLAKGLGGFLAFESVRMNYLVALSALDARLALAKGGLEAVQAVPDPAKPGSFFQVESTEGGVLFTSAYVPAGKTNSLSFLVPTPGETAP